MVISKETKRVVVYLPKDMGERLEKEAEEKGLSVSSYVRMLIIECVKQKGE